MAAVELMVSMANAKKNFVLFIIVSMMIIIIIGIIEVFLLLVNSVQSLVSYF